MSIDKCEVVVKSVPRQGFVTQNPVGVLRDPVDEVRKLFLENVPKLSKRDVHLADADRVEDHQMS